MAKIKVDGHGELKVLGSLGYVHDVGAYVKEVELPDGGTAKAVKRGQVLAVVGCCGSNGSAARGARSEVERMILLPEDEPPPSGPDVVAWSLAGIACWGLLGLAVWLVWKVL